MAHEKVYGFCESKCKVEVPSLEKHNTDITDLTNKHNTDILYFQGFTYVVDSDQKLLDWANKVSGNDYTSVLIKKGEWTSSKGVNLTTTKTKVVVGEVDSELSFNAEKGLYYDKVPTSSLYYIRGVTVSNYSSDYDSVYGFYNCTNLTNCYSYTSAEKNAYSFYNCTNLTNCNGSSNSEYYCCFTFYNCENLINCNAGTMIVTQRDETSFGYGFYNCTNLTNCNYKNDSIFDGLLYYGAGFYSCFGMSHCKCDSSGTLGKMINCYASQSEISTYAVADTANGGFNYMK